MTDETTPAAPANSAFRILAAIADLGEGTAAAIAEKTGLGYSTVTPKLRAWETAGQAEKYYNQDKSQTLWRLTDAGKTATAAAAPHPTTTPSETGAEPAEGTGKATTTPPDQDHPAGDAAPNTAEPAHLNHAATAALPETTDPGTAPVTDISGAPAPTAGPSPVAAAAGDQPVPADIGAGGDTADPGVKRRRPSGAVEDSALAILRANPGCEYKVGQMKAAIDEADAGTGYARVSEGATTNALNKLAHENKAVRVEGRKAATYTLAPTSD